MVTRKFLFLLVILVLISPFRHCLGEEQLFDKVSIIKIEFFQKGKLTEALKDDAPARVRAYLEVKEIMPEFRDKFRLVFYLDDSAIATFPISDIRFTPFVDYLWEEPSGGLHSIGASLFTMSGAGKRVFYKISVEEVKPVLKVNRLEIDTMRRLEPGDRVKFFLFVSNDSEKVILPNDFIARLELRSREEDRTVFLDFGDIPRIGPKAHNISLGPIQWIVEDGSWLAYPEIMPKVVNSREVIEVLQAEDLFLDLRISESRPDLILKLSLSPSSPYMGEKVEILVNVENMGDLPCEKYGLFLYVDGRRKGSIMEGPAISPGKTKNFRFDWTAESGTHYLKASMDYEFDNRKFLAKAESPLTVETGINLVPVILSWKPGEPQTGDTVSILTTMENTGKSPITAWDEEEGAGYKVIFSIDGVQKEVAFGYEIAPGKKSDFDFTWEAEEGEHLLKISCIYFAAKDMEPLLWSDEKSIKVVPSPKLVCVRDNWVPNPPTEGDIVVVSLVVKNDGQGVARPWDEDEKTGYKVVFSVGSEEKEDSKTIAPGKEVTFSFHFKMERRGEYPVKVLFIHPSGKEIVKPYTGTFIALSPEPIDELARETLKFLAKRKRDKASLYKSLGKSLEEFLRPFHPKFKKLAKKTGKIALSTLKSSLEENEALPSSDENVRKKDIVEVIKTLEEIMEDIDIMESKSTPLGEEKADSQYGILRNHIARFLVSEGDIASLMEKEADCYSQMAANNLAVAEEKTRPHPDAKNELLKILKGEENLGIEIYQDFQKEEGAFAFLKREAKRENRAKIQLALLKSIASMLRSEGVRAGDLEKEFYSR